MFLLFFLDDLPVRSLTSQDNHRNMRSDAESDGRVGIYTVRLPNASWRGDDSGVDPGFV